MGDLGDVLRQEWRDIKFTGNSIRAADIGELVKRTITNVISKSDFLSLGITSNEDLRALAERFFETLQAAENPHAELLQRYVIGNVERVDLAFWFLLRLYGVQQLQTRPGEFASKIDVSDMDADDAPSYALVALPDHPRSKEVVEKIVSLWQKRHKHSNRYKMDYDTRLSSWIIPGFNDWRAAIAFASYSHMWSHEASKKKYPHLLTAFGNSKRYVKFGLTSFDAVKQVKPGALFQVENVFGDFAAQYVSGDLLRFKELLPYAQMRDAKQLLGAYSKIRK